MKAYTELQKENIINIETQLNNFGVVATVENISTGPVVTRYELALGAGVRVSKIQGLEDDLALALKATSIRLLTPIPGTSYIGIEIPNEEREIVPFVDIIPALDEGKGELDTIIGYDTTGNPVILDIASTPHMLVAGQTGSGKSVMINTMISSLMMKKTPEELQFIMVDPKVVELIQYADAPHLLHPIITDANEALKALKWAVDEMEDRYVQLAEARVRNLKAYNAKATTKLPYIVFVIDEMADLMLSVGKSAEAYIQRITQKARAVGIHMVLATQRPSVNVVTGTIKANVPTRIAFQVASTVDSMTILGQKGAEQLLGRGDMLLHTGGDAPRRIHGAFITDEEIDIIVTTPKDATIEEVVPTISFERAPHEVIVESVGTLYEKSVAIATEYEMITVKMLTMKLKITKDVAFDLIARLITERIIKTSATRYYPLVK